MNSEKEQLLKNPLVKELMLDFKNYIHNTVKPNISDFIDSQLPKKEWEILSFQLVRDPNTIFKLQSNGFYKSDSSNNYSHSEWTFENMFIHGYDNVNSGRIIIYSVKRLFDGEIFTIGDRILLGNDSRIQTLYKIELRNNWIYFDAELHIGCPISTCIKINKQPLFTTEDNINVFENDKIWLMSIIDDKYNSLSWKPTLSGPIFKGCIPTNNIKWFSTKEAAEEYILMNKPCLSFASIMKCWNMCLSTDHLNLLLKTEIKSKLK